MAQPQQQVYMKGLHIYLMGVLEHFRESKVCARGHSPFVSFLVAAVSRNLHFGQGCDTATSYATALFWQSAEWDWDAIASRYRGADQMATESISPQVCDSAPFSMGLQKRPVGAVRVVATSLSLDGIYSYCYKIWIICDIDDHVVLWQRLRKLSNYFALGGFDQQDFRLPDTAELASKLKVDRVHFGVHSLTHILLRIFAASALDRSCFAWWKQGIAI